MRGKDYWAEQYTKDRKDTTPVNDGDVGAAYVEGFNKAVNMAADLIADLSGTMHLAILVRAIGTANVDTNGKAEGWDE